MAANETFADACRRLRILHKDNSVIVVAGREISLQPGECPLALTEIGSLQFICTTAGRVVQSRKKADSEVRVLGRDHGHVLVDLVTMLLRGEMYDPDFSIGRCENIILRVIDALNKAEPI